MESCGETPCVYLKTTLLNMYNIIQGGAILYTLIIMPMLSVVLSETGLTTTVVDATGKHYGGGGGGGRTIFYCIIYMH